MAFRQENPDIDDVISEVKPPAWAPDLSAQNGAFGRLATLVMMYPRAAFVVAAVILIFAFLVLAPILVAVFYMALGVAAYVLWGRIKRLRMPRVIPLSHSSGFQLQNPRQDLTQLIGLNLVALLFAFFGGVMIWDGGQTATGAMVAAFFGGFALLLARMAFKEIRGRLYFQ